ncbi:MAG: hypothetical protein V4808_07215 [Pseudomonadota bacterium]
MKKPKAPHPNKPLEVALDVAANVTAATTAPQLDVGQTAGTLSMAPPASEPAPDAEPVTRPREGGRFVRDRATGHLTKQEI